MKITNMKTVFKTNKNELKQEGVCTFILNRQLAEIDEFGNITILKNKNIDLSEIDELVLSDAKEFKQIKPTYNNVANQVFAGDIQGVFLSGEFVNVTKTSLAPTTKIENNLQLAVLSTATYLYEKEQERS
jgi:maleate cis-trans isomerase